jgi:hypothetical protein
VGVAEEISDLQEEAVVESLQKKAVEAAEAVNCL